MVESIFRKPHSCGFYFLAGHAGLMNTACRNTIKLLLIRAVLDYKAPTNIHKEEIMLSKKVTGKSVGKVKSMRLLAFILITAVAVSFTMADSALAKGWKKNVEELDPVNVFIEWNTTDGDQGIQFFWDSAGFTRMLVFNESGKKVLDIETKNGVKDQGLTEVAIESVEPEQSEQTLEEFFERFPEGIYKFWGKSIEGGWLYGDRWQGGARQWRSARR